MEDRTPCVGITGGIGTGKSTVSASFARRGTTIIEADQVGHDVLREDRHVHRLLAEAFGTDILEADGQPNRKRIADVVFSDPAALSTLNDIVHPPLLQRLRQSLDSLSTDGSCRLVAVDAALITEWDIASWFDLLVVVVAPTDQVRERLAARGLTKEQIEGRIASQLPEEARLLEADVVIRNDGDLATLDMAVEGVWQRLVGE
jgi:dephospho-CoA kinase